MPPPMIPAEGSGGETFPPAKAVVEENGVRTAGAEQLDCKIKGKENAESIEKVASNEESEGEEEGEELNVGRGMRSHAVLSTPMQRTSSPPHVAEDHPSPLPRSSPELTSDEEDGGPAEPDTGGASPTPAPRDPRLTKVIMRTYRRVPTDTGSTSPHARFY